jgi:hypothetical protein
VSSWPRWQLDGEERALARYVRPDIVAKSVQLPGPSDDSPLTRLRAVYQALAAADVGYAHPEPSDEAGRQVIRPPDEVLGNPRHGTCLDLALVMTGACLVAGLHTTIVIVEPRNPRSDNVFPHAVVLVRLSPDTDPLVTDLSPIAPDNLADHLQSAEDGPVRSHIAVDPVGIARSLGTSPTGDLGVEFDTAIANGHRYLTDTAWAWRLGLNITANWRTNDVQHVPARSRDTSRSTSNVRWYALGGVTIAAVLVALIIMQLGLPGVSQSGADGPPLTTTVPTLPGTTGPTGSVSSSPSSSPPDLPSSSPPRPTSAPPPPPPPPPPSEPEPTRSGTIVVGNNSSHYADLESGLLGMGGDPLERTWDVHFPYDGPDYSRFAVTRHVVEAPSVPTLQQCADLLGDESARSLTEVPVESVGSWYCVLTREGNMASLHVKEMGPRDRSVIIFYKVWETRS